MPADRADFLTAIEREPGNYLHRYVYADWLDEHDEPERAEFIRLGCELAGMTDRDCDPSCGPESQWYGRHHNTFGPHRCAECWSALRSRVRDLFERHAHLWVPVPDGMKLMVALVDASGRPVVNHAYARGNVKVTGDLRLYFDRGFGTEWEGPLTAWAGGGGCGRCEETGRLDLDGSTCSVCEGTGRVPGVGAVVARHPIEVVRTEREPMPDAAGRHAWFVEGAVAPPVNCLPRAVFDLLRGHYGELAHGDRLGAWWPTRAAALAALSDALTALARGVAGSPGGPDG